MCQAILLQFEVESNFPVEWNDYENWKFTMTACKTTMHLVYDHKYFFTGKYYVFVNYFITIHCVDLLYML